MDTAVTALAFDVHLLAEAPSLTPVYAMLRTQYGISRGLREFGLNGNDEVNTEMRQLHELEVMTPRNPSILSD